jgi:hypothetical protein
VVLADVVGSDRQLAVAAVGDDGELDTRGAAVVEERLDRRQARPSAVEDVVDQDARAPLEGDVELRLAHERLRVQGGLAAAHVQVVAVEGDVDRPEIDLDAAEFLDQPAEAVCERDAARVDTDERDALELCVRLDDLVGDPMERARERICVEENPFGGGRVCSGQLGTPFRPHRAGLKCWLLNRVRRTDYRLPGTS